jgi:hypothetical protein
MTLGSNYCEAELHRIADLNPEPENDVQTAEASSTLAVLTVPTDMEPTD